MRPSAGGRRESDSEVPLARRSLLEQMAGTFFVIYSYSSTFFIFFCSLSLSLSLSFRSIFSILSFHLCFQPLTFGRTRTRDNVERDFAHVLLNRGIIVRILNVKYTFKMKGGNVWIHLTSDGADSSVNKDRNRGTKKKKHQLYYLFL